MAKQLKNMMGAGLGAQTAKLINGVVFDGLTATGSTQADALPLPGDVNVIGTVPSGAGVILPSVPQPGDEIVISNLGANSLNVYPSLGGTVQGGAANAAYSLAAGAAASFIARRGSQNWVALSSSPRAAVVASNGLAMGMNVGGIRYWNNLQMFTDIINGDDDETQYWNTTLNGGAGGYTALPLANQDANGNPTSMPANGTNFVIFFQIPDAAIPYKVAWTDPGNTFALVSTQGMTSIVNGTHSFTFTPTVTQPAGGYVTLTYTGFPTNFSCRPVTDDGSLLAPNFKTKLLPMIAGAPVRVMDLTTCTFNSRFLAPFSTIKFPVNGDGQLVDPIYTSTTRNTSSWNFYRLDGMPIEKIIAVAAALNHDIYWPAPYNCDSTYLATAASLFAAHSLATGLKVYIALGNEIWNNDFMAACQCQNEATQLGISKATRYGQKAKALFDAFTSAFTTAGVLSKLVRVLDWQNGNSDLSVWTDMLAVTSADALSVAPYVGSNVSNATIAAAFPTSYIGSLAGYWSLAKDDCDAVLALYKAHSDFALAHSLKMMAYEGGPEIKFDDGNQLAAAMHDANYYDFTMYWLQEMEKINPAAIICPFTFNTRIQNADGSYSGGLSWGFLEGSYQAIGANTPKYNALTDYNINRRKPVALTGSLLANLGAASGTEVGPLKRWVRGSSLSFQSNGAGLAIDASGNVTISDSSLLPVAGSYTAVVRQTDTRFPSPGYLDTNISLTVAAALLQDNFNAGTTIDATKWGAPSNGLVSLAGVTATGQTITQSGGQLVITEDGTSNRGIDLPSASTVDLTVNPKHFVKIVSSSDLTASYGLAFGTPGGNVLHLNRDGGNAHFEYWNTVTGYSNLGGQTGKPISSWPWIRLRYTSGDDHVHLDLAPPTASNPPLESDWSLDISAVARPAGISTTGTIGVFYYNQFGATAGTIVFDGFNTAT